MRSQSLVAALSWVAIGAAQTTITGQTLRIMPLGDSITVGACSSNGNGYRGNLTEMLDGNQVNLIGSSSDGSARDHNFEAHGGYGIDSIRLLYQNSKGANPNVILVHAGTNDLAIYSGQTANCAAAGTGGSTDVCQIAANRLSNLLDALKGSGALLCVAQITPSLNATYDQRIVEYNKLVSSVVQSKVNAGGFYIQLVDQYHAISKSNIDPNCGGGGNIVHPNDDGYKLMATAWKNAIAAGISKLPSATPKPPTGVALRNCSDPSNNSNGVNWCGGSNLISSRGQTNFFYGVQCSDFNATACTCKDSYNNGANFTQTKTGTCADMTVGYTTASRWADLNGDGKNENVIITQTGGLNVSMNLGTPTYFNFFGCGLNYNFSPLPVIQPGPTTTKRYQVRLADIDADDRAEYIIMNADGSAAVYQNTGDKHTIDSTIRVNFFSAPLNIGPFGVPGIGVQFQDFDGDGRPDYVYVAANGTTQVWLNKLSGNVVTWVAQGTVTPPFFGGTFPRDSSQIIDVNSDGRADFVQFDKGTGAAGVWLNYKPASGNTPNWSFVSIASATNGTSAGAGGFNDVGFADVDGDGNADYIVTNAGDSSVNYLRNRCINYNIG